MKMGKINTNWKKRFFVLSNGELSYYKNIADEFIAKPRGRIVLISSSSTPPPSDSSMLYSCPDSVTAPTPYTFSLWHPPHSRLYFFCASSQEEMSKWVNAIGWYTTPAPTNTTPD